MAAADADNEYELSPVPNSRALHNPMAQFRQTSLSQLHMRAKAKTGRSNNFNKNKFKKNTNTANVRLEKNEKDDVQSSSNRNSSVNGRRKRLV